MKTFGEALREKRMKAGLSYRQLATRIGYSHVHIYEVEHGAKPPSRKFAAACDKGLKARGKLRALADTRAARKTPARQIYISDRLWNAAQEQAQHEGRTVSHLINELLENHLKQRT